MLDFLRKPNSADSHNFVHHASGAAPSPAATTAVVATDNSKFSRVLNFCLYALILLVPVLFLPLTSEIREFNKQSLVIFAVVIMLGSWVIRILTTRRVSWTKTALDYALLVYLGVAFLASLVSIDKVSSFLGYYGRFTGSFISIL